MQKVLIRDGILGEIRDYFVFGSGGCGEKRKRRNYENPQR